jgi:REP element-mobilizing transposase RayT
VSDKYKITEKDRPYYLTLTVVGWIDVFTRPNHKAVITESLKYCQQNKGLEIYGWCLMSNHLHLIAKATGNASLPEILRDFKKHTSKAVIKQISEEPESRREWMLEQFKEAGKDLKRITNYKFWQDGNQAKEIYSNKFFWEKLNYIHQNPVQDLIVEKPEDYLFSSARNYADLDSYIEVVLESSQQITYK